MIIAYILTADVVVALTLLWLADWRERCYSIKERSKTMALLPADVPDLLAEQVAALLNENEQLRADNEAYCQREMTAAAELLDLKQQIERLETDPLRDRHPNPSVTTDDQKTNLRLAEDELQNAHEALLSRARGTVFGYDTYASLPGKQAAALVEELLKLRSRIKILEDTTSPREPGTP
jgi:hypothetical protein